MLASHRQPEKPSNTKSAKPQTTRFQPPPKPEVQQPIGFQYTSEDHKGHKLFPNKSRVGNVSFMNIKKSLNMTRTALLAEITDKEHEKNSASQIDMHPLLPMPVEKNSMKSPKYLHSPKKILEKKLEEIVDYNGRGTTNQPGNQSHQALKLWDKGISEGEKPALDDKVPSVLQMLSPELSPAQGQGIKKVYMPLKMANAQKKYHKPHKSIIVSKIDAFGIGNKRGLPGAFVLGGKGVGSSQDLIDSTERERNEREKEDIKQINNRIQKIVKHSLNHGVASGTSGANGTSVNSINKRTRALVLLDHDLDFVREYLKRMNFPAGVQVEKLENYENIVDKLGPEKNKGSIKKASQTTSPFLSLFVFIKLSPRMKEKTLSILKELAVIYPECCVVKCVVETNVVDLNIDYRETRRDLEHKLVLSNTKFDTLTIAYDQFNSLKNFMTFKLVPSLNQKFL